MSTKEKPDIRGLRLFQNMATHSFETMMRAAYVQEFPAHLQLIRQGTSASFLHVLINGSVELFAEKDGRETTMAILPPPASFILAACISDAVHLMSARTLEPCKMVLIPAVDIRTSFKQDSAFAVDAIQELALSYRFTIRQVKNLKLRSSRERLAAYLLKMSNQQNGSLGFSLQHEKRLIASYLGMTPESLSRCFKSLIPEGVHIAGPRVTLTDPKRLRMIAGLDPLID